MVERQSKLAALVRTHESHLIADWIDLLAKSAGPGVDRADVEQHARAFLPLLADAMEADDSGRIDGPVWAKMRDLLTDVSATRARRGSTPSETATFVLSFKQPFFSRLQQEYRGDAEGLARHTGLVALDALAVALYALLLAAWATAAARTVRGLVSAELLAGPRRAPAAPRPETARTR